MIDSLSEQRKEVAEKLRNGANNETLPLILNVAFAAFANDEYSAIAVTAPQAARRLADLIDPTCDFEESDCNSEFAIRLVSGYICHNCGHEAIVKRLINGWAEPPHYCPYCGARVVNINDAT